jgi:hypothetical protein
MCASSAGIAWWSTRTPDVSGRGDLANGNWWAVTQDGDREVIEETHRDSREVWKRGTGRRSPASSPWRAMTVGNR